jgi:ATP-binding cassette subfamily F protein 3
MGQNGAGKSTIVKLIAGALQPSSGCVNSGLGMTVAMAKQVMPLDHLHLTVREYFLKHANGNESGLESRIVSVLQEVKLTAPFDREVRSFSGGQQARLLLAAALINEPDILILDEPTNNLDMAGINDLTNFIQEYNDTCLVISHDEKFLNSFSDSVLYLDCYSKKVEQYDGDYMSVKQEIARRMERETSENARKEKLVKEKKAQANAFSQKGGNMRAVAKKMKAVAEEVENSIVEVKREDKHLLPFIIPTQGSDEIVGAGTCLLELTGIKCPPQPYEPHSTMIKPLALGGITIFKGFRLRLTGPNGCGKSTVLKSLMDPATRSKVCKIRDSKLRIGYYSQDFSGLNMDATVIDVLRKASLEKGHSEQYMRHVAANFFISGADLMRQTVGTLSEGQKGLLTFATLVLMEPGLLILDEPTNHINFRHIPAIAKALSTFEGGIIIVSHDKDFCKKVKVNQEYDLGTQL